MNSALIVLLLVADLFSRQCFAKAFSRLPRPRWKRINLRFTQMAMKLKISGLTGRYASQGTPMHRFLLTVPLLAACATTPPLPPHTAADEYACKKEALAAVPEPLVPEANVLVGGPQLRHAIREDLYRSCIKARAASAAE